MYRVIQIGIFEAILPVVAVMLVTFFHFIIANIWETSLVHPVSTKNFWPPRRRRGSGAQKEVSAKRRHRNRASCSRCQRHASERTREKEREVFCVLPITHRPPPDTKKG